MNLKSFFKKLFFGDEVLEKIDSPINGEITVVEGWLGGREVKVGGVTQSGGSVEQLWKKGLKAISNKQLAIKNCLILGLGCGTVAKLINEKWPEAKIVGVEIDPEVVKIGRKYFGLNEIPNLKIEIADAVSIVHSSPKDPPVGGSMGQAPFKVPARLASQREAGRQSYNLILVDLYFGQEFPKEAESEEFLIILKKILENNGLIIFNRLYFNKSHQELTGCFLLKIKKIFRKIETIKVFTNLLILCEK